MEIKDGEEREVIRALVALVTMHGLLSSASTVLEFEGLVPRAFLLADLFMDRVEKEMP